jgi:hypothetical protein
MATRAPLVAIVIRVEGDSDQPVWRASLHSAHKTSEDARRGFWLLYNGDALIRCECGGHLLTSC